MKENILAEHVGRLDPAQIKLQCRRNLIPGLSSAHDLEHLERTHPSRHAVERAGSAGMRIGASQNLPRQREAVFEDHLMADAAASHVVELLDVEILYELANNRMSSRNSSSIDVLLTEPVSLSSVNASLIAR